MSNIPDEKCAINIQLDRMLTSAVVLSWADLLHASQTGLIQIEYAPGNVLPYVKVWDLTGKGVWRLVCEYWVSRGPAATQPAGMTFSNDFHSVGLAEMLGVIMQHRDRFANSLVGPGVGLIQVTPPTDQENVAASASMRHAYASLGLNFAHIPTATMA